MSDTLEQLRREQESASDHELASEDVFWVARAHADALNELG